MQIYKIIAGKIYNLKVEKYYAKVMHVYLSAASYNGFHSRAPCDDD